MDVDTLGSDAESSVLWFCWCPQVTPAGHRPGLLTAFVLFCFSWEAKSVFELGPVRIEFRRACQSRGLALCVAELAPRACTTNEHTGVCRAASRSCRVFRAKDAAVHHVALT